MSKIAEKIKNFAINVKEKGFRKAVSEDEELVITIYSVTYVLLLVLFSNTAFLGDISVKDADCFVAFFKNQGILTTLLANVGIVFLLGWDYIPQKSGVVRVWDMIGLLILMVIAILLYAHAHHQLAPILERREFLENNIISPLLYIIFVIGLIVVKCHLMEKTIAAPAHAI